MTGDPTGGHGRRFDLVAATADDLDRVQALEEEGFPPGIAERREVFLERIATFPEGVLLLRERTSGVALGYVSSEVWDHHERPAPAAFALNHSISESHRPLGTELYVSSMTVASRERGRGLGRFLFATCLRRQRAAFPRLRTAILVVAEEWRHARRIYEGEGFREVLRLDAFFRPEGRPAMTGIVMRGLLRP